MRHHPLVFACALLAGLVLTAGGPARAADPKAKVTKIKVMTSDHKEYDLDLTKEEDLRKVQNHLVAGEIERLQAVQNKNLMEIRWEMGLWTIVVFVLLFLILKKAAWGPMLVGLQKREENIQAALVEARQAREEAAKLKEELAKERSMAAQKVAEMLAEARKDAEYARNEMIAKAKTEIQTERDRLLRELSTAKDQALQEIWDQGAQLASLISTKAIGRSLNLDDHRRLVDEALVELKGATQTRNGSATA